MRKLNFSNVILVKRIVHFAAFVTFVTTSAFSLAQSANKPPKVAAQGTAQKQVSTDEFGEALGITAVRILPKIAPAGNSSFDIFKAKSEHMLCVFDVIKELDKGSRVFSADVKTQPLGAIREKVRIFVPAQVEKNLKGQCLSLAKGRLETIMRDALGLLEDSEKFEAARASYEAKKKDDSLRSELRPTLNVLGLVPGQSSEEDVRKISIISSLSACDRLCLNVGGFDLSCTVEYDDKKILSSLTCWFGDKSNTNIEVFNILEEGFTNKFGKPNIRLDHQVQNAFGVKFNVAIPKWQDQSGNTLELQSRAGVVDRGAFGLKSGQLNLDASQESAKKESARKF